MKKFGHVKISRKTFDELEGDPFWSERRSYSRWEAWVYLIQLAQWGSKTLITNRFGVIQLERGEFVASIRTLAEKFQWSVKKTRLFLNFLATGEKGARIRAQRETQAGMVYLIVKYDTYQSSDATEGTDKGTAEGNARAQQGHKNKAIKQLSSKEPMSHEPPCDGAYPPEFELVWNAYPKRSGTNNKQAAYRQYQARLAAGESFDAIHDGTLRYAKWAVASGIVGQRVVLMAATFFGRDKHYLEPYDLPDTAPTDPASPHHARATVLYGLYLQHGFSRVQSEDTYKQTVKALAHDHTITEPRRFWAELKAVQPWAWIGMVRTQDQARAIARIAEVIATVPPVLESHQGGVAA